MRLQSQASTGLMSGKQFGFFHNELTLANKQVKRQNFLPESALVVSS